MTSQIIFPKEPTYWILSDGVSYYDGLTPSNCVTTVGAGTTVYWIGTNHQEYVQACLDLGLTPRNPGENPLITIDPASPVSVLDKKVSDMNEKLVSLETVVPGERISARQARLWLIHNGIDLNMINSVIDSIEDPVLRESIRTEWEYAPYIERSYQWINSLAFQLGLSASDLDRAFIEGSSI
jgi:hypothetical protein